MTSITKQVWTIIDEDPSLRKDLARDVINVSGLAAYLKKEHHLEGSVDAVISAIRRYHADENVNNEHAAVRRAFSEAIVSTKTRITALHLKNSSNLYKYLSDLMKDPEFYKSEVFRLIKTRNETLVMLDQESLNRAKTFFPEGNVVSVEKGLALLSLTLTRRGWETKGIMARLANEIANYGVSIRFIISADPSVSIFVREEDLTTAHQSVISLTR